MLPRLKDDSDEALAASPGSRPLLDAMLTEWEVELWRAEEGDIGDKAGVLPAWSAASSFAPLDNSLCMAGAMKGWRPASAMVMRVSGSGCSIRRKKSTAMVGFELVNSSFSMSW